MKRLMLVRHGESEWNAGRRLQGQADIGLSPRGEAQARALAPTVAGLSPDRVVTSDLKRARNTAELLGFPDAELRAELREIDVGAWTGEQIADLVARDEAAYRGWRTGTHTPPDGEAWSAFRARTEGLVRGLLGGHDERILVVCHGGVIRSLLQGLGVLTLKQIVPVGPGSLTLLQHARPNGHDELKLEVYNFSPDGPVLDAPD